MEEETSTKKRWGKKAIFLASAIVVLIAALAFGAKAIVDKNNKPSELDIWNQSRATATTPATASDTQTETSKPVDLNEKLGRNNDMTIGEAFKIKTSFFPGLDPEEFNRAAVQATQTEIDTIREAVVGKLPPSTMTRILQKYGLNRNDWLG